MDPGVPALFLGEEDRGEAITASDVIVTRMVCAAHPGDQISL